MATLPHPPRVSYRNTPERTAVTFDDDDDDDENEVSDAVSQNV